MKGKGKLRVLCKVNKNQGRLSLQTNRTNTYRVASLLKRIFKCLKNYSQVEYYLTVLDKMIFLKIHLIENFVFVKMILLGNAKTSK